MENVMIRCQIGKDLMKLVKALKKNFVGTDKTRDYLCSLMYHSDNKTLYGTDGKKAFRYRLDNGLGEDIPDGKYKATVYEDSIILENDVKGFPVIDRIFPSLEDCEEFSEIDLENVHGKRISKEQRIFEISSFFKDLQSTVNYTWIVGLPDSLKYRAFLRKKSMIVLISDNRYGRFEAVMMIVNMNRS